MEQRTISDTPTPRNEPRADPGPVNGPLMRELEAMRHEVNRLGAALAAEAARREWGALQFDGLLRALSQEQPVMVWATDTQLRITLLMGAGWPLDSGAESRIVGHTLDELFREPGLAASRVAAHRRALNGETVRDEYVFLGKIIDAWIHPLVSDTGERIGTFGIAIDATKRRRAEEALRESEERLRLALDAARIGTWDWNVATNEVRWSENLEALHGIPPGSFDGRFQTVLDSVHVEDRGRMLQALQQALDGRGDYQVEYRLVLPDGSTSWIEGRGKVVRDATNAPVRMIGTCMDISERKSFEESLRQSEGRYQSLVDTSPDAIIVSDLRGVITMANREAAALYGCAAPEELLGRNAADLMPERDRPRAGDDLRKVLKEGGMKAVEYTLARKDGTQYPAEISSSVVMDARGAPTGLVSVVRDISERKQAEAARSHLAAVVESSDDAVVTEALDGTVVSWNHGAEELYGYTAQEMIGKPIFTVVPPDRVEETTETLKKLRAGERVRNPESVRVRKDGSRIDVSVGTSPIRNAKGEVIAASVIARDITETRRAAQGQRFLAEATAMLSSSLEYQETLQKVARLAVPAHADWCAIHLKGDRGALDLMAMAHRDPQKMAWARELTHLQGPNPAASFGASKVVRTGKSQLYTEIPSSFLDAAMKDADDRRVAEELGFSSAMVVPLSARGRTIGALTLVRTRESGRRYGLLDLAFAEELARRVGMAVDNARLYRSLGTQYRRAQQHGERLQAMARGLFDIGLPVTEAVPRIMAAAHRATGVTRIAFCRFDPVTHGFSLAGFEPAAQGAVTLDSLGRQELELIQLVGSSRQTQYLRDCSGNRGWDSLLPDCRSIYLTVVSYRDHLFGVLVLLSDRVDGISSSEGLLADTVAAYAGVVIENTRLYEQVQALAVERERVRISHEMHDGLAQVLGYVNTKAQAVELLLLTGDVSQAGKLLNELSAAARRAYSDVREGILALRTQVEPGRPLETVLSEYLAEFERRSGIRVTLEMHAAGRTETSVEEVQVLRILQEALRNVRKHAHATQVAVRFTAHGDQLEVEVEDNGVGFRPSAAVLDGMPHLGLQTMKERAASVGGELSIESAPGRGTRVRLVVSARQREEVETADA